MHSIIFILLKKKRLDFFKQIVRVNFLLSPQWPYFI